MSVSKIWTTSQTTSARHMAYLAIMESMQNQLGERDIINETHDFVDLNKIGIEILMQAFSFFSGMIRILDSKKRKKQRTPVASFFFLALSAFLYIY